MNVFLAIVVAAGYVMLNAGLAINESISLSGMLYGNGCVLVLVGGGIAFYRHLETKRKEVPLEDLEERLQLARKGWHDGFPARVDAMNKFMSKYPVSDTPTPRGHGDD